MKQIRLILLTALLTILCSSSALAAEFSNAYELYEHWYTLRTDQEDSPYPAYVCGVWTTDNCATLTIALTKNASGEAGKAEILELIEDDNTVQFTWQTYSHAELFAIQWELTEFLGDKTGAMTIGVNEMDNVVDIGIDMNHPGSEAFMQECFERYGNQVRFEDMSGMTLSYTAAENFGLIQPGIGGNTGSNTASGYSAWYLWALTALFALFCLTLWRVHLRRGTAQRADGGTEIASLSMQETETAIREHLISPPAQVRQAIFDAIQEDTQ